MDDIYGKSMYTPEEASRTVDKRRQPGKFSLNGNFFCLSCWGTNQHQRWSFVSGKFCCRKSLLLSEPVNSWRSFVKTLESRQTTETSFKKKWAR